MREIDNKSAFLPTRLSLLSRLRRLNDDPSWQDFFDTYWKLIYGFARKAGLSDAEAQDAAQETLLSVTKTMPKFQYRPEECSFKGWLRHLTEKRIIDQLRKRPHEVLAGDLPPDETPDTGVPPEADSTSPDLEAVWHSEWEEHLRTAALEKLQLQVSGRQYQIFHQRVIQGKPVHEVCQTLGVTLAQVHLAKMRLSRKLKAIRKRLEQNLT